MRFWAVTLPFATVGIEERGGKVVKAPPIVRWMVGKPWPLCAAYILRKGGTATLVHSEPEEKK